MKRLGDVSDFILNNKYIPMFITVTINNQQNAKLYSHILSLANLEKNVYRVTL